MRIRGRFGFAGLTYVNCVVTAKKPAFSAPVRMAIDTGASVTTILDRDVARIGLTYGKMKELKIGSVGIGGRVRSYIISDVTITFPESEPVNHQEQVDFIIATRHVVPKKRKESIEAIPSVLGIHLLKKYNFSFDNDGVILELPNPPSV